MKRPSIKSPCVADRFHMAGERIAEFMTPSGKGGLFRVHEYSDGAVVVEVYRCSEGIQVFAPRDPLAPTIPNATADALAQAEAFIRGFEDDEMQEGIPDMLAGLRAAISRERSKPDAVGVLKRLLDWGREHTSPRDENSPHALLVEAAAVIAATESAPAADPRDATPDMLAALKLAAERLEICNYQHEEDGNLAVLQAAIAAAEGAPVADPRDDFIGMVSRLNACGDNMGEGEPTWEHDTGDSLDALDALIHKARQLCGEPHDAGIAAEARE